VPSLLTEIRQAARGLRRNAGFTVTAIAALSLGIAANTAIFSVVDKVLLEPLPYPDPDRIVQLISTSPLGDQTVVSIPKYRIWREHAKMFEPIAAYDLAGPAVNLTESDTPQPLETARVTADYFRLFGADVVAGSAFSPEDDKPGAHCTAVISSRLWRERFKGRPTVAGGSISLDHAPCKVTGVLAPGFRAEKPVDIWLPLKADLSADDHMNRVRVAARLKPGVTLDMAKEDAAKAMQWFILAYPYAPRLFLESSTAKPLRDAIAGDVRPALFLLTGAVGFVLLIACANVSSLVMARTARRASEIAMRAALGANRRRLFRELMTENMLIAGVSSVAGLILGIAGVRGLLALGPPDLPRIGANSSAIALDWKVFLFTALLSILSGALFGVFPALGASRANVASLVNDTQIQSGMGFRRGGRRALLVISEVALALILLMGAGLLIRTFVAARSIDRGFDERHVLTIEMPLSGPQFERTDAVSELIARARIQLKQVDGLQDVATTSSLPLEPALSMPFTIIGHDQTMVGKYHGAADWRSVSPEYFAALQIRLLRGRLFTDEDNQKSAPVILINRMMMRRYWPEIDANPIGQFMVAGKDVSAAFDDMPRQIVGIVDDVREAGMNREPMMYVPVAQLSDRMTAWVNRVLPLTWVVRTSDNLVSKAMVEHELRQIIGRPLGRLRTMHEVVAASSARGEFYALLLTVFGGVALLLAAVGIYGVMAYSVEQRRSEIGLRMALGATPANIRNMVVWHGMRLVLIGAAIGIPAALALTRVLVHLIYGIETWDPAVMASVAAVLMVVALAAAYLPSSRATDVSPCEALRR